MMASDFVDDTGQHISVDFQEETLLSRISSSLKEIVTIKK